MSFLMICIICVDFLFFPLRNCLVSVGDKKEEISIEPVISNKMVVIAMLVVVSVLNIIYFKCTVYLFI